MTTPSRRAPTDPVPPARSIRALAQAAQRCEACPLFAHATQAVFGEGATKAPIVLVGEQPGDAEDLSGHPFVGPAGRVLDSAIEAAGLDRGSLYLTNAVKHFKWEPRGKRRIHKKPNAREISACRPWLEAEVNLVKPNVIVCLGATAAQALLGPRFKVSKQRGKFIELTLAPYIMATVHPSSILRAPDDETRHVDKRRFIDDLKRVAGVLSKTR